MPNVHKIRALETLTRKFGQLHKIPGSESLFRLGEDAARIYFRYSKIHASGGAFFGVRDVDLRQLEGYNSFLCFLVDDGSAPLLIPYADFEDVFRNAETAKDGQYKVQLLSGGGGLELYIPRQGRFNLEGYSGFEALGRSLDSSLLRQAQVLTHSQVQTFLAGIGRLKGFDVFVPESDVGRLDWTLTKRFHLRSSIPSGFEEVREVLSEIDVIWVARGGDNIEGLFEVEHSTTVYSGLLRFNDIRLTDPNVSRFSIVSDDRRRGLFARQLFRPTFRRSGLAELTSFLEYSNVVDWHARLAKRG